MLRVHKIAKAASLAFALVVLSAAGLPEVSDRRVLSANYSTAVELAVEFTHTDGSLVFSPELDVHISDHVVADVVRHNEVFDLTVF